MACGILVPQPRTQPEPPAVETWSPNHRTTRDVPDFHFFKLQYSCTVLHKLQVYNMYMLRCFSGERLFAAPGTVARQAPLCMGFSRQESWSGLPGPLPRDLLNPGIEPEFPAVPALQVDSLPLSHQGSPRESGKQKRADVDDKGRGVQP